MENCQNCFQLCFVCLVWETPDCPICKQLQDEHWQKSHIRLASSIETGHPINGVVNSLEQLSSEEFQDRTLDLKLSIPFQPNASSQESPPISRRRDWTAEENIDFERWITSNPKPTKQQKYNFSNRHKHLTYSQVQNKINNWRNGRNTQKKRALPPSSTVPEAATDCFQNYDQREDTTQLKRVASLTAFGNMPNPEISGSGTTTFKRSYADVAHSCISVEDGDSNPLAYSVNHFASDDIDIAACPADSLLSIKWPAPQALDAPELTSASELFHARITDNEQMEIRPESPVSSIIRYMESPELEADISDIEMALKTASEEDLRGENAALECMRLPSVKRQTLLQEAQGHHPLLEHIFSESTKGTDFKAACDRCKERGLSCNQDRPCSQCNVAEIPCSNCIMAVPTVKAIRPNRFQGGFFSSSKSTPKTSQPVPSPKKDTGPFSFRVNTASRAHSVVSARTSHSGRSAASSQSARYSIKLNRRASANNRRHSAVDVRTAPKVVHSDPPVLFSRPNPNEARSSSQSSRSFKVVNENFSPSIKTNHERKTSSQKSISSRIDDGRGEYFRCSIAGCTEIFDLELDLRVHKETFHFECHCTFCDESFQDQRFWHFHEAKHIVETAKKVSRVCDDILWRCGVCSTYGLCDGRRYMHVRRHWKEGLTKENWKGGPQILPLSSKDIGALESMSSEVFQITAEHLLSALARRSGSFAPVIDDKFGINSGGTELNNPHLETGHDRARTPAPTISPVDTAVDAVRPMVHGMFASLRRKLPLFRTKPP